MAILFITKGGTKYALIFEDTKTYKTKIRKLNPSKSFPTVGTKFFESILSLKGIL